VRSHGRERGSALLLSIWALLILSGAVIAWAKWIQQDLDLGGEANRSLEARAMAHSGVTMALHMAVTKYSPQLEREFATQLGYRVRIVGEGGKLHINQLIAGEDPAKLDLLRRWLEQMGLGFQEREQFVDCLLDYTDGDNVHRLNGVEDEDEYHPPNRPLLSVDELTQVRGSEPLVSKPGWREQLTIYGQGKIDLSAATADILGLLGLGDARIQLFLKLRAGADGIDGTKDDLDLTKKGVMPGALGLTAQAYNQLSGIVIPQDPHVRITSLGQSGKVIRKVEVVARKGAPNPPILYWKE